MLEFKYDHTDIHLRYDKARRLPDETLKLWMETISKYVPQGSMKTIIDLGCGTGRFTKGLSDHFSAKVYGMDLSRKMLSEANRSIVSPLIEFIQGSAENIPLNDGMNDLVFISMVYHHIQDKNRAAQEIARVLKPGGFLCIRTSTTDTLDSYLYLRFFPEARQINLQTLPSRRGLTDLLQNNGFVLKGHSIVHQGLGSNLHEYFEKINLRGLSDLASITDDAFRQGLMRLEKYCREREKEETVFEDIDLFIFRQETLA